MQDPGSTVTDRDVEDALRYHNKKSMKTLQQSVLANSAAITSGSALSGYVLESIRRALKGKALQYEDDDS